jgi:hypothetical protein
MPNLSPRENYLRALRHEEYEYVPMSFGGDVAMCGLFIPADRPVILPDSGGGNGDFRDGFGVRWVASDSAVGGAIPAPGEFILTDVTQWKKKITIPDLEQYNWQKFADDEEAMLKTDRSKFAVGYFSTNGIWERIAALMGFEEAMIAMMEEPEACYELFAAITDFKIKLAEKVKKYFNADTFTNFDDIATERNLFMSPETYRKLIKPHHTRLNAAVKNLGMIPVQHTCGHAEICVADYIETGADAWNTVQPTNDLAAILDKYGDKFSLEGGFDMNGKPGRPDSTIEEVIAEVERCFKVYGKKKGYIFAGMVLTSADAKDGEAKTKAITETANKLRFAGK